MFLRGLKWSVVLVLLLVVIVVIGAVVGVFGLPSVESIDNEFGDVTEDSTEITTNVTMSNPNPFGIRLGGVGVDYAIEMNELPMANGSIDRIAIGTGNSSIELTTIMDNAKIPSWWVSHIDRGEQTDIDVSADVSFPMTDRTVSTGLSHEIETALLEDFVDEEPQPISPDSPLLSDPVLYVNETDGSWGTVTETTTPVDKTIVFYNPNVEPVPISELRYEITMNDILLGDGATEDPVVIGAHEEEALDLTTVMHADRLDEWWVTHLDGETHEHQVSELRIEFEVTVQAPTGESVTVPLDELTYEELIETDVFDEGRHG